MNQLQVIDRVKHIEESTVGEDIIVFSKDGPGGFMQK